MVDANKIELSVALLGLDGSGKTLMVNQLMGKVKEGLNIMPTAGFTIHYSMVNGIGEVLIYDVSGVGYLRDNWRSFYENVDGILFFIDLTDMGRIENIIRNLNNILNDDQIKMKNTPIFIIFNKNDKKNRSSLKDFQEKMELKKLQKQIKNPISFKEMSAKEYKEQEMKEVFQFISRNQAKKI